MLVETDALSPMPSSEPGPPGSAKAAMQPAPANRHALENHLGYGTLRMEPEYMKMGQAAGVAAHLCVREKSVPSEVETPQLQKLLRDAGAIIDRN